MTSLPTSRQLLTTIISSLTSSAPQQSLHPPATSESNNPLSTLPASHRALLTTLHVLFPPGMLLQALDLLDRGLVTKLIVIPSTPPSPPDLQPATLTPQEVIPPQAHIHLQPHSNSPLSSTEQQNGDGEMNKTVFAVKSSQEPSTGARGRPGIARGTQIYAVRLESWNCSCAAFAFSAFPSTSSSWSPSFIREEDDEDETEALGEKQEAEWSFGGRSFDDIEGDGNVPVCKHLLACLLVEKWRDVLGGYVKDRSVRREEMAGFAAE